MIFKKPYAFLIKYFKLINFLLAILTIYLTYRTYQIVSFFNSYITSNYTGNFFQGFYNSYISPFLFLISILVIIGILGVYLLFLYKKKPNKTYLFSLIYYFVFLIFLIFMRNTMINMVDTIITAEEARIYRDISLIVIIPQIVYIVIFIIRGTGFNISKFNFQEDLKELEISEKDSEEIEITIKKDDVKLRRNVRRFFREFTYYIKENKFIFIIICIILSGVFIYFLYKALPDIVDRRYTQGDSFVISDLVYQVEDSIITNLDYKGDILAKDKYYVVIRVAIENKSDDNLTLDYNRFRLEVKDRYAYPILDKGIHFIDYATNHYNREVKAKSKTVYSLVYEIESSEISKSYRLKVDSGNAFSKKLKLGKFDYITITPIVMNKILTEGEYNLGDEIVFQNSNLNNSKVKFANALITDKYIYDYEYCIKENCQTYKGIVNIDYITNSKILVVLDYEYVIDKSIPFANYSTNINKFTEELIKIKYVINGEEKIAKVKSVTPRNLSKQVVLETTKEINDASSISLLITIRNKQYNVKIK